ncbi:LacI family DNA-binding transcriptional regulator [Glutamicibacter soli]|uniref:LacI family DNA-binding transcriptional regulator n=1 Tax=Micrococcaceae TaxID=1268 RepID=UPI00063D8970|nr:LacI family DNA-binding transcriptional regulator [Arthrobacter sp. YC-RL1]ALD62971.1 LacI family transcriptional regulator [Arthrobacter sp. LS16]ALQ31856.1 LacI family transcriptional regulator [Arthrobacter sp. YC-RL1]KLI90169.1 LacI family transcriptional regulator [Arthrobacter sp. YC-RL1]
MSEARKQQPTLELVAERAGVSRATVSRVVNGSEKVKPEAMRAVEQAIRELNYVPNRAARSLAQGRTNAIALVVPENTAKFFADPYFAKVVQGAAQYLADTEFMLSLLLSTESDPGKTTRYLRGGNVDGALVLSHHSADRSYADLGGQLPLVFGGRTMSTDQNEIYVVDIDNIAAAKQATNVIIDRGRRRIATIAGPQDMGASLDRLTGFTQALAESGLEPAAVLEGDFTPDSGHHLMSQLIESGADIDGLFVASAQMAFGALQAMAGAGLNIPQDVSVTTVDDDAFARNAVPPLTTIAQHPERQGAVMAEILIKRINGESVPEWSIMDTELILRASH